jgi:SWIM zinc finger
VSSFQNSEKKWVVSINLDLLEGWCECQLFEFKGILCRHILTIFHKMDVKAIPSHFILPRWTKSVIYDMDIAPPSEGQKLSLILRNMTFYHMVHCLLTYLDG